MAIEWQVIGVFGDAAIVPHGAINDLDGKKTRRIWLRQGPRRITRVAQPLKDQVGVQRVMLCDTRNRHARCRRLQTDRPLLLIGAKPLPPTGHHARSVHYLVVVTIDQTLCAAEQRRRTLTAYAANAADGGGIGFWGVTV